MPHGFLRIGLDTVTDLTANLSDVIFETLQDRYMSDPATQIIERLLDRLQHKDEEIGALRQKLAHLEDEREDIRRQITGYFDEDVQAKELEAARAVHDSLFGPDGYDPATRNESPQIPFFRVDDALELRRRPKHLRETSQAVARLGAEVDAARLATELGISCEAARLRLSRACSAGLIKRLQPGKYVAAANASEEEDIKF